VLIVQIDINGCKLIYLEESESLLFLKI